ncbi:hypothetical protein JXL21_10105 [Candidatus Bathyarchaeota archaeon]|nr:hypothetical protein [Candidatus Bathyarchaeota archaeon]
MSDTQRIILSLIIGSVLGLLLGVGGAYVLLNSRIQVQASEYEGRLAEAESGYEVVLAGKEQIIFILEKNVMALEERVAELEESQEPVVNETAPSQEEIDDLMGQVSSLESQVESLNADVLRLEAEVAASIDVNVTQQFDWTYDSHGRSYVHMFPLSAYSDYSVRERLSDWADWVSMCADPGDDEVIEGLAEAFTATAESEEFNDFDTVNLVAAFVQSLPFTEGSITEPWDGYPRYPLETLFSMGGDSVDSSILAASILDAMGYDVGLVVLEDVSHVGVVVAKGDGFFGTFYEVNDVRYYYLETVGSGWKIGARSHLLASEDEHVYLLG